MSGLEFTENTAMSQAMKQAQTNQTNQASGAIPTGRTTGSNTSNPFGFGGVSLRAGTMAYAPIRNAMGSEAYIKLGKQLKEMAKDHNRQDALEVRVIELDRNVNPNLHFASYVVCVTSLQRPDLGVGYNVIMMEATGEAIPARVETFTNGEPISIPVYSEEVDNALFKETVEGYLRTIFGTDKRLYRSDTEIIPTDFNYEDTAAVEALIANAAAAATASLVMFAEGGAHFSDLNLVADLKSRQGDQGEADLTFQYKFDNLKKVDYLKLPTRASIVVHALTGFRKNQRNQMLNSGNGPRTLTEATGFMELLPVAPRHQAPVFNPATGMMVQPSSQRLAPVFVLNSLSSTFGLTPASMMLNVLVAADLNRGSGWVHAFNSKAGKTVGGIDLTDVTAITIDMPSAADPNKPEVRPAVPAGGMPLDTLMKFLGTYCQPDEQGQPVMYLALDVPLASHTSWYMSIFMEAATGNPAAVNHINAAMDSLTNNQFTKTLPPAVKMFATTPMVMERGYWEVDGDRRDVADIDYVAVCNYADANNNPGLVEKWNNTFFGAEGTTAQRLSQRRDIIQEITGRRAHFIGKSVRVFWNGAYLAHGLACLARAGITTSSDGRGNFMFQSGRPHADFLTGAALPSGAGWNTNLGNVSTGGFGGFSSMWSGA